MDLTEQKKQLEIKRSMMNQYPGGQHFSIVQEHDKLYRQKKDFAIASIEQKRRSEKLA